MLAITAKTPSKRIRKIRNLVGLQSLIQIDLTVISYTNSGLQIINTPIKKARTLSNNSIIINSPYCK